MTFTTCIRIVPLGPFDLARLALFGFGHRHHQKFDGTMRLAFVGDDHRTSCAVAVTQLASGVVECVIQRDLDSDSALPVKAVGAQIERMCRSITTVEGLPPLPNATL